jgi:uncharacterized RDD family membrane protein YckC
MAMPKVKIEHEVTTSEAIEVYLLAAPEDERICQTIKKYLTPVIRNAKTPITLYDDFDIPPGQDKNKYKQKLYDSEIVLAFISVDYLDNNECHRRTQKVIERYNKKETILLPILVRNCLWKSTPFVDLQLLPKNKQPLNNKQFWNSEDDALTEVANEIYDSINDFDLGPSAQLEVTAHEVADNTTDEFSKIRTNWRRSYYRRTLGKRGLAYLLDIVLTILPWYLLLFWEAFRHQLKESDILGHFIIYGIPTLSIVLFCALLESQKWRGTFGKILLKMQTTDVVGNQLSFPRALWRNFLRFYIGGLWVLIIPEFILHGVDGYYWNILMVSVPLLVLQIIYVISTKKILHDQMTNTIVGERLGRATTGT